MKINYFVSLFWIGVVFILFTELTSCESKKETLQEKEHSSHVELAELMFHNQRYLEKMYFAGINNNWVLTKFYHHELEETMEKIIHSNILEDGKNISELTSQLYSPSLKEMESAIAAKDSAQFIKGYTLLVTTCNNCHVASDHAFVKIKTPVVPSMTNQEFK